MVAQELVHGEHVNSILLEDGTEGVVASNLSLVLGILEIMLFEVGPQSLDRLRPRELQHIESTEVDPSQDDHWDIPSSLRAIVTTERTRSIVSARREHRTARARPQGQGNALTWKPPDRLTLDLRLWLELDSMLLSSSTLGADFGPDALLDFLVDTGFRFVARRVGRARLFSSA